MCQYTKMCEVNKEQLLTIASIQRMQSVRIHEIGAHIGQDIYYELQVLKNLRKF